MQSLRKDLKEWGISDHWVSYELFGGGVRAPTPQSASVDTQTIHQAEIVFARSQETLTWTPSNGTLLEFAEAYEINPPFSCRSGICGNCMCKIEAGEVAYPQSPTAAIKPDAVLICISKPHTPKVVLNF